jgi:uncharacterized protein (DUF697 family)
MESFFAPAETLSPARRAEVQSLVTRAGTPHGKENLIHVVESGLIVDPGAFVYDPRNPGKLVCEILENRPDLSVALARQFHPFRQEVVNDVIRTVSKENALFSVATALPDVIPFLSLPWAVGEFASDTAVLTANQVRMAFILAAASDRKVGYREQKAEIASLFAGAFGWRALARELVGKIPLGGGLIAKAGVAYAATFVVGTSLERYYRLGYGYTPAERRSVYDQAFAKGKQIAASLVDTYKKHSAV